MEIIDIDIGFDSRYDHPLDCAVCRTRLYPIVTIGNSLLYECTRCDASYLTSKEPIWVPYTTGTYTVTEHDAETDLQVNFCSGSHPLIT